MSTNVEKQVHNELRKNSIGLLGLISFSLVNIFPLSFAVTTAATAVVYGGFAAPLVPLLLRCLLKKAFP